VVEQGTHKPLVGSSNLPPGILCMAWVYILRGSSGRHYIGSAVDLDARFAQHLRGHTHTTKRLGERIEIVASKKVATLKEARKIERSLKAKKNPTVAIYHLQQLSRPERFRCWSGVRISPLAIFNLFGVGRWVFGVRRFSRGAA
jgi:predicted GIY-YIG superfamily endonuclease